MKTWWSRRRRGPSTRTASTHPGLKSSRGAPKKVLRRNLPFYRERAAYDRTMERTALEHVAILGGTGRQGRGLAQRFAAAGLAVTVGSRDAARAREATLAWQLPVGAATRSIAAAGNAEAVAGADVVLLAVPFTSVDALLADVRSSFRNTAVVVDVTVPITFDGGKMAMLDVPEKSAAEHIRARLPERGRPCGRLQNGSRAPARRPARDRSTATSSSAAIPTRLAPRRCAGRAVTWTAAGRCRAAVARAFDRAPDRAGDRDQPQAQDSRRHASASSDLT